MLDVQSLAARRGGRRVFRDVSFTLAPGAALMVRGPNGSGKSSLLRTLSGLIAHESGEILWQGVPTDTGARAHRERICYVSHLDALKPELSIDDTLDYWRALGLSGKNSSSAILDVFGLGGMGAKKVRVLSAGQKRRLGLTRLLLSDAPLWLLDEPATSLDSAAHRLLDNVIARHRVAGGMAVIVSHHDNAVPDASFLQMGAA